MPAGCRTRADRSMMSRIHSREMTWQNFHVRTEYLAGLNNPPSTVETAREVQFRDVAAPAYRPREFSPEEPTSTGLFDALASRRSPQSFGDEPLRQGEIDGVLQCAFTSASEGKRPTPSAGCIYAVKAHLVPVDIPTMRRCMTLEDHPGRAHQFWNVGPYAPGFDALDAMCLGQLKPRTAALLFLSCEFGLLEQKYGVRGYRFGLLEVGHVAQNIALAGQLFGIATHFIGGFADAPVARTLGLDADAEPACYGLALGRRLGGGRRDSYRPMGG